MLNTELKINKYFREKDISTTENIFSYETMRPIRKVSRKENNHDLSLLMFYENIKNIKFKLFSSVIYCMKKSDVYADYMCCP